MRQIVSMQNEKSFEFKHHVNGVHKVALVFETTSPLRFCSSAKAMEGTSEAALLAQI